MKPSDKGNLDEDLLRDLPIEVWTEGDIGRTLLQLAKNGRCKYTRLNTTLGRFEAVPLTNGDGT